MADQDHGLDVAPAATSAPGVHRVILPWTPELDADVAQMTPRQFEAKYPGLKTSAAIHIRRRVLRDAGVMVVEAPIGRKPDPVIMHLPELPPAPSDEELWAAYDKMYETTERYEASKALLEAPVAIETDRPFGVVFMSDFHIGGKGVDTAALREDIELITSCNQLKVYLGGDHIDNFVISALANVHRDTALVGIEIQFELFKTIIRRLLAEGHLMAVGTGNHDAWTKKMAGIDGTFNNLRDLPVLHTAEDTYLNLTVGGQEYVIYRKHRPTRSSQFNDGHGVQHMYRFGERSFDVGVMEHHHVPHISTFMAHGEMRWAIRTGSYKLRDGHAREWGFQHSRIGTPVLVFFPFRKTIIPFMSVPDAIDFLEMS